MKLFSPSFSLSGYSRVKEEEEEAWLSFYTINVWFSEFSQPRSIYFCVSSGCLVQRCLSFLQHKSLQYYLSLFLPIISIIFIIKSCHHPIPDFLFTCLRTCKWIKNQRNVLNIDLKILFQSRSTNSIQETKLRMNRNPKNLWNHLCNLKTAIKVTSHRCNLRNQFRFMNEWTVFEIRSRYNFVVYYYSDYCRPIDRCICCY